MTASLRILALALLAAAAVLALTGPEPPDAPQCSPWHAFRLRLQVNATQFPAVRIDFSCKPCGRSA